MQNHTINTSKKLFKGIFLILFCLYPLFTTAQDTTSIELVGQFGGYVSDVALQEDYAFVLKNRVLTVLDISNNQLNQVTFLPLKQTRGVIFVAKNYAYLGGSNSLDIVNISDPMNPVKVSTTEVGKDGESIQAIYAQGNFVYLAQFDAVNETGAFYILDVSDPSLPVVSAEVDVVTQDVFVVGNIAYLITGHATINLLDIRLRCYDISDPSNPIERGNVKVVYNQKVFVAGNYAYVVGRFRSGLSVVDISNPDNPTVVADHVGSELLQQIVVVNQNAYAVDWNDFIVINVSNPTNPTVVSKVNLGSTNVVAGALRIETKNGTANRAFVARSGTLHLIDVSTPENPTLLDPLLSPRFVNSMGFYGDNLFVADGSSIWRYELFDSNPVYQDKFDINNNSLLIEGDHLYVTDLESNFTIFDISNPANPFQQGIYTTYSTIRAMAVSDSFAYVIPSGFLSDMNKLEVIDVQDPSNLFKIGEVDLANIGVDIFVPDTNNTDLVYVVYYDSTDGAGGMQIIDVADPSSPATVSTTLTSGKPTAIWVDRDMAYVGSMTAEQDGWFLEVFDVSDSQSPSLIASNSGTGSSIWDVTVANGTILATFPEEGIRTFELMPINRINLLNKSASGSTDKNAFDIIETAVNTIANGVLNMATQFLGEYVQLFSNAGTGYYEGYFETHGGEKIPKPVTTGPGGGYEWEIKTPPKKCCIGVWVEPQEAREAGCTASVTPTIGKCGTPVALTTKPAEGWVFDRVEGSLFLLGEVPTCNIVDVYFKTIQPTLTLSGGAGAQHYCPCDSTLFKGVIMLPIGLSADEVDSWIVYTVTFQTYGSGNEMEDIKKVRLHKNNINGKLLDEKTFYADDFQITMNVKSEIIAPGGTLGLVLVYEFSEELSDSLTVGKDFKAKINISGISAQPQNYLNGVKLPPPDQYMYGGPIVIARIWNSNWDLPFDTIQEAIDSEYTTDGDVIEVCPGFYRENVVVTKSLTIRSKEGREVTTVGGWMQNDVFQVKKDSTTIQGFTIEKTYRNGISIEKAKNCVISENRIVSHFRGIELSEAHKNLIMNNEIDYCDDAGVALYNSNDNKIIGNKIDSTKATGIFLRWSKNNLIENNEITNNNSGIFLLQSNEDTIINCTKINLNSQGIRLQESHKNVIENNVIKENWNGIYMEKSVENKIINNNKINENHFGISTGWYRTNNNLIEKNEIKENKYGIYFEETRENEIKNNEIKENKITGIYLEISDDTKIISNKINSNDSTGIYLYLASPTQIRNNQIWFNCRGIADKDSLSVSLSIISGNSIIDNKCSTGIHLDNSNSAIIGNTISSDEQDGIHLKNGSNPAIQKNNIFNNNGFGLNNLDPSVTVQAPGNWWGDASGPSGEGSGSGDEVSGGVDFSNWLASPVSVVVIAGTDSAFIPIGQVDSLYCSLQNWENLNDIVDISIEADSTNWITSSAEFSVVLHDSMGAVVLIHVHVPSDTKVGASSKVRIKANSQSDPTKTDVDSFYVIAYNRYLAKIEVTPGTALLRAGQSMQFSATGYDSVGKSMDVAVLWSATGGLIDSSGFFTAGSDTGSFFVHAKEPIQQMTDSAVVKIFPMLATIELSPDSVVLEQGDTFQFNVSGYDSLGAEVEVLPILSATGGTIDPNGLYTAGSDTGLFRVVVRDSLVELSDTALVFIRTETKVVKKDKPLLPTEFVLGQNYPNPFNPETTIEFSVKEKCQVKLKIFNITGREVVTLVNSDFDAGYYRVTFDARNLATGLYLYRIQMKDFVEVKKMVLLE